jgi:hypothetical protein
MLLRVFVVFYVVAEVDGRDQIGSVRGGDEGVRPALRSLLIEIFVTIAFKYLLLAYSKSEIELLVILAVDELLADMELLVVLLLGLAF